MGTKTRSRDATLSRHSGIKLTDLHLSEKIASTPSGETWKGTWQGNAIAAKFLKIENPVPDVIRRASRAFSEEFPKLRIFSHPNVLPVIGCTNAPPDLVVINQYMVGNLFNMIHGTSVIIDYNRGIRFALDIAKGMSFLHSLEPMVKKYFLNSRHVYVSNG